MAKTATKSRVTKKQINAHRDRSTRDTSPTWDGCEDWDADKFHKHFRNAMDYYRLETDGKFCKPAVIKWLETQKAAKEDIDSIKKLKDSRISSTMGAVASCLLRGMTPQRNDFNNGRDSSEWLRNAIVSAINDGKNDIVEEEKDAKPAGPVVTIQDRVRESAISMTDEIEDAIESWIVDADKFNPKAINVLSVLKGKEAKAAHARIIKGFYEKNLAELEELASGDADEQLREGYSHRSKKQIRSLIAFYQEVMSACDMLAQEAKVNRKPRKVKAVSKDKLVAKLKYKKSDDALKLVSINPTDIIGSKELWVYNTKNRKLGKYIAEEFSDLGIKGTTITGFSEIKSVCKTIRKPDEKLKEFKAAGKVQLRKFLDDINATDTRMNGRINEEIVLLKVQ